MADDRQKYSVIPMFSTVRFSFDFSHIAAGGNEIQGNSAIFGAKAKKVIAFSYGLSETDMSNAGFGATSRPGEAHTNLQKAYQLPTGQAMRVQSIAFQPIGILTKPASVATADSRVSDADGDQYLIADTADGKIYSTCLEMIERNFSFSIVQGQIGQNTAQTRLPAMSLLGSGRGLRDGRKATLEGLPFVLPTDASGKPIVWTPDGDGQFLRIEAELKKIMKTPAWDGTAGNANTAWIATLAAALSQANAAAPAAGAWIVNLDAKIVVMGVRAV